MVATNRERVGIDKDGKEYKYINLEPHWCGMYANAVAQVKAVVAKEDMRDFIVEMLEFGGRLYKPRCEDCNASTS
tara:strand:+ start:560 stop:784 length:225 start_codon:yes stop_codon:yes gene_type:complete